MRSLATFSFTPIMRRDVVIQNEKKNTKKKAEDVSTENKGTPLRAEK